MESLTFIQRCGCTAYMLTKLNIWLNHSSNPLEVGEFKGISLKLSSTNETHKSLHIILILTLVEYYTTTSSVLSIIDIM
jgi:hypothetical protein